MMKNFLKKTFDWFNGVKPDDGLPKTDFCNYMKEMFGIETVRGVLETFQKLGLPAPEHAREFMKGTEGALLFLNKYGVVIRIEDVDPKRGRQKHFERINDNPWVVQPLAAIRAKKVIIEVCPGCHVSKDYNDVEYLDEELIRHRIGFWDDQLTNSGRMPIKMPSFPEGVPIIIDRLAVQRITKDTALIRKAVRRLFGRKANPHAVKETKEAAEAQEKLYGALRRGFNDAWGKGDMQTFWISCAAAVAEGKLIAGWQAKFEIFESKSNGARAIGAWYGDRLK